MFVICKKRHKERGMCVYGNLGILYRGTNLSQTNAKPIHVSFLYYLKLDCKNEKENKIPNTYFHITVVLQIFNAF